jgi:hypothetical protein
VHRRTGQFQFNQTHSLTLRNTCDQPGLRAGLFVGDRLSVQNSRLLNHAREVSDRLFIDDRRAQALSAAGSWRQPAGKEPPRPLDSIEIQARPEWLAPSASRRTGDRDHAVTPHYRGPLMPTAFRYSPPRRSEMSTPRAAAAVSRAIRIQDHTPAHRKRGIKTGPK